MNPLYALPVPPFLQVRDVRPRDLPAMITIERQGEAEPWTQRDWRDALTADDCTTFVVEIASRVVGFMAYRTVFATREEVIDFVITSATVAHLDLINFGVHEQFRHRGAGTALIEKFRRKVCEYRATRGLVELWDGDLGGHLFVRAMKFKAIGCTDDTYFFEWRPSPEDRERYGYPLPTARKAT